MYEPERWMELLRTAMLQANIRDYAELCRATNIRQSNINRWREGRQPGNDVIRKLSRTLQVPVRDLLIAAGHFEAEELPGNDDILLSILDSDKISDKTKLQLIREWRAYEAAAGRLRAQICRVFSSKYDADETPESEPPSPARKGTSQ